MTVAASALATLLKPVVPLSPELSLSEVADRLLTVEHKVFLSLPVVDADGLPLGLVSGTRLQDIFMQRFGRDLRGRHPVHEVMNAQPLVIRLDAGLEAAAQQVTARLQYPITEDFILVDARGRYRGLGTVLDLLKAMEARVAQRNQVLHQALVDLKESQAQLVQSEKMASLGQMVAGVAHELNTPLGYVKNNVQLLKGLAQAHPRLLSLVVTPFRDTQSLLALINEAQIFRYLPRPVRPGLFDKGLQAAAEQARQWRAEPSARLTRQAQAPRDDGEKARVGSLLGMLGRLRERLSA